MTIPQRYKVESWNEWDGASLKPTVDGDLVLYADAEKWVQEEIAALKEELKLNASMLARQCDLAREAEMEIAAWHTAFGTTQLSHATESFRRLNEEIAALKEKIK